MYTLSMMVSVNSTAALMKDGEIVACAGEDRFARQKSIHDYPRQAIDYCLAEAGITAKDIDKVVLPYKGFDMTEFTRWTVNYDATFSMEDKIREQHEYFKPVLLEGKKVDFYEVFKDKIVPERWEMLKRSPDGNFIHTALKEHLGIGTDRVEYVDHHESHKYYALYSNPKPKDPCLVFCMEACGGDYNGSVSVYRGGTLKTLYATHESWIGRLYRYITLLLGMKTNEHEYKVMGLAPYCSEYTMRKPLEVFRKTAYVDGLEFKFHEKPRDIYFHFRDALEPYRFDGIAGALQRYTEELITEWVVNAIKETGISDVLFTGGVAMNIKAMMELGKRDEVSSVWVGGTSSDECLSMGALFQKAHLEGVKVKPLKNLYLGKSYTEDEVARYFAEKKLAEKYEVIANPTPDAIAERLERGEIMARFAGREEFGARALGNRSIMANPAFPGVIRKINDSIKNRDFWMPFAPVVLHERQDDYLINPKGLVGPHMSLGFETKELAHAHLPGALHPYDRTARPQILRREDNPGYYDIVKAFEKRTGIGSLLNTSFNLHGEAIVHTLDDVFDVFDQSKLDFVVVENMMAVKRG